MVVTDVGGLPEQVPHERAGLVVAPTPEAISQAIHRFFTDPELRQRLQEGIRQEKQRFSWDYLLDQIEALYQTLRKSTSSS